MRSYGYRIKELRKLKDMQQSELAEKMQVAQSSLSELEKSTYPPLNRIEQVCEALNINIWEFFLDKSQIAKEYNIHPDFIEICQMMNKIKKEKRIILLEHIRTALRLAQESLSESF
jgi:transcriptional regulator with XRE-family HTH domain